MAGSIKGITIEIGGDTTKLSKALSGVNSSCSSLQKELREVDKLLKLDPTNTELLAQKQKILKEAIGSTKEKLETLKEAEKQVQEQFENGEVSEEQYRALQREIASTEIKLGNLEKQAEESNKEFENTGKVAEETAKSVSKIDTAAKVFDTVEDKAGKAAKAMAPLSAAAAAVGTGAVAAAMNLDDGYDIIITKTGATGEALDDLNKRMNNIFKDIPTDAETAGTAIGEVNTRFQLTGDELESLSKQFIEFAEINGTDLNSSIDNVDTILNKFNVDAGQAGNVLGLLTKVGQDTGLSMDTLESSLMQNGSTLKEMGLGITESVNLLAMFENNGVDATTAMAGLKKAVKNYTAEGLSTDQALQKTIDSIKNASTETEALSIAQETFGSKGFAEMAQAIREGKLSVDDLGGSLEDYSTTVQDTYESTLDPWDNAKVMLNNLKLAGSDLAGTALSALQPAIEKVTSTVQSATEWFRGLSDNQKEMIATIAMIVAAIAPALLIISKVAGVISTMINVIKTLQTAITAVNAVLAANPIILVIAAIAALIAIFITLYNKCEWFRDAANEIFENVKEFIGGAIEVIKGVIGTIWDKIQEIWGFIEPYLHAAFAFLQQLGADIAQIFSDCWEIIKAVWDLVEPYFSMLWENIKVIFSVVGEVLGGFFSVAWEYIKGVWDVAVLYFTLIWENIKVVFSAVGEVLGSFFRNAWEIIKAVWDVVAAYFAAVWNAIKTVFSVVKDVLTGDFKGAWDGIKSIFEGFANFFSTLWDSVKRIFSAVGSFFRDTFGAAWDAVKGVFSNFSSFFSGLWDTIRNTFSDLGASIADAIGGAVKAGINGVISIIENTINGAIGLINGAINLINKIPGVSIGKMSNLSLPRLAHGGIIGNGGAMVAEAGPELVQMVNGKAVVTPLTNTARNIAIDTAKGGRAQQITNEINVNIEHFENNRDTDIRELTEEMLETAEEMKERDDRVYA